MPTEVCTGWCSRHCEGGRICKTAVQLFIGGDWPLAGGFDWQQVDHFHVTGGGVIQGFDDSGEPVGPAIECEFKVFVHY